VGETEVEPLVVLAVKLVPVQEVALVDDQVRVADCPEVMLAGETEREAVGAGVCGAVTVMTPDMPMPPAAPWKLQW
jgi:hypothetical protein